MVGIVVVFGVFPNPYYKEGYTIKSHKEIRALLNNDTYEVFINNNNQNDIKYPLVLNELYVDSNQEGIAIPVRIATFQNPSLNSLSFSVFEPGGEGGCAGGDKRTKTSDTAQLYQCLAATNAGFFNTDSGACLGNIVSEQRIVQIERNNANFGIKQDGSIITGYLSREDIEVKDNPFLNLVAGVIWLVRNGRNFVKEADSMEDMSTQTTGSEFSSIISARTAIGHDREGRLIFVEVEGKSRVRGFNLTYFADFLINRLGIINAINLDGGGSSAYVINNTLANVPSDNCNEGYSCERKITTIVCLHEPSCPNKCNGHGECKLGKCDCNKYWKGDDCSILKEAIPCPSNCTEHGECHEEGYCICFDPWSGPECDVQYPKDLSGDSDHIVISKKLLGFTTVGIVGTVVVGVLIYLIITKRLFPHRVENWIEEEKIPDDSADNLVELERIECSKDDESISDDPSSN